MILEMILIMMSMTDNLRNRSMQMMKICLLDLILQTDLGHHSRSYTSTANV